MQTKFIRNEICNIIACIASLVYIEYIYIQAFHVKHISGRNSGNACSGSDHADD